MNEQLRDECAAGLLYMHSRANANTSKSLEIASFSYALIELLSERGIISLEELDERKKIVGERLMEKLGSFIFQLTVSSTPWAVIEWRSYN